MHPDKQIDFDRSHNFSILPPWIRNIAMQWITPHCTVRSEKQSVGTLLPTR